METCPPIQGFCVMMALKPVVSMGMAELPTAVGEAAMAGTNATTHDFSHNDQVGFMGQYQGFIKPHTLFDFEKQSTVSWLTLKFPGCCSEMIAPEKETV